MNIRVRSCPSVRSFTLVEILAATSVLTLLFTIMFGILQQTSRGWQAANRRVEASQVARLALDQIASDLENCVAISAAGLCLPRTNPPGVITTNYAFGFVHAHRPSSRNDALATESLPSSVVLSQPNDYIFVVTPYPASLNMGTGDLCEVGYVPVYIAVAGGYGNVKQGRYVLLRHLPLQFSTNSTSVGNAQPVTDFLAGTNWFLTPMLRDNQTPRNFFPIVDNLIAFNVEPLYRQGNNLIRVTNFSWGRPSTNGNWNNPNNAPDGLPLAADITLSIFDDKAAERIQRIPSRGLTRGLDEGEIQAVSQSPVDWNSPAIGEDVSSTLRESVLTLRRRVFFKNAQP